VTSISDRGGASRYSDVEYVFEPHGSTQAPLSEYVRDLWDRRRFVQAMAHAELRGSRSNTVIGELWGVFDPLVQGAIYWFLFSVIRGTKGGDNMDYLTVVIAGVFFFNFTRIALSDGGRAIIKGKGLMLNSTFPRALLPLAAVYRGLLEFIPAIPIYMVFHLLLGAPIGAGIAMLPLLFALQVAMSIGLALLMSTAIVIVRDTANLLNYVMRVLIFVTPVIYPVESLTPLLRTILSINPLFALFAAYQAVIFGEVPSIGLVLQAAAWAALLLTVGIRTFRKHEHSFALYL
jgi:teichoic acid transport system permease protein